MSVAAGSVTTTWRPSGYPPPLGLKVNAFDAVWIQFPEVAGSIVGRTRPSTAEIGSENVTWIGVEGSSTEPGAGFTTAWSRLPIGNQLTRAGAESVSHGRAAAETVRTPKRFGPVASTPVANVRRGFAKVRCCSW